MRRLIAVIPLLMALTACSNHSAESSNDNTVTGVGPSSTVPTGGFFNPSGQRAQTPASSAFNASAQAGLLANGEFANSPEVNQFIDRMVQQHGFERQSLRGILAQAQRLDWVIRLMDKQAPAPSTATPSNTPNGSWLRYRQQFITPETVQYGAAFWSQYQDALNRAQQVYGVPPEIIVGIIGVETRWGRVMGKTRILDALATLAFAYPRRAEYFQSELAYFLLMAREDGFDPLTLRGSFAGAMGYGQFMPSAFKKYAVDFNGDGIPNLWDPVDAIGSVANYFKSNGWQSGGQVAVPASGQTFALETGFKTHYSLSTLAAAGLRPNASLGGAQEASLLRLDMGSYYQFWYGLPNFYAITRYNKSVHYAMAVWQLGEEVKKARQGY
ncbi:lytic murein transglycosylase B [Dickeya lacustris]|uniref:Lytic murein transglycosylase B n=1 Tax=Dickeya lacustris TaxID=2259638 RepID=A0ABY8GAX2_9GAMM|nr:lytic murein transglycosylase B [Dickeya lacustris]WFN57128.1 lytic murein transglycosylase B [Dickeya lacustris]